MSSALDLICREIAALAIAADPNLNSKVNVRREDLEMLRAHLLVAPGPYFQGKQSYPAYDALPYDMQKRLADVTDAPHKVRAVSIGEFRAPKKGEWFLSGSTPEAFQMNHDGCQTDYFIARIVIRTWSFDDGNKLIYLDEPHEM